MIYLDHRSSAPLWPTILPVMHDAAQCGGNPSSLHGLGRVARRCLERAADAVRALLGAGKADVVYTSGAEEANALGFMGVARARRAATGQRVVIVGHDEAPALGAAAEQLASEGFDVRTVDVQRLVPDAVTADIAAIALSMDGYATGLLQPVKHIAALAGAAGVPVHCDATRAAPVMSVNFLDLQVSTLAVCGPRLGGPAGTGALVTLKGLPVAPLWGGGGQQNNVRSGTPAVAAIAGLGEAARCTRAALTSEAPTLHTLSPELETLGETSPDRLLNMAVVCFDTASNAESTLARLSAAGIMANRTFINDSPALCFSAGWSTRVTDLQEAARVLAEHGELNAA